MEKKAPKHQGINPSSFTSSVFDLIGQIQMVELLVANGASLNAKSVLDETPLGESGGGFFPPPIFELNLFMIMCMLLP